MERLLAIAWALLNEIPSFFMNPLIYVFLFLVWMQYQRNVLFERKLLHVRINNPWLQLGQTVVHGLWAGLLASVLVIAAGLMLKPADLWMLWALAFLLSFLHIQYFCVAYGGGLLGLLHLAASFWPQGAEVAWLGWLWTSLMELDPVSLLVAVAIFHLIEALLVKRNAGRGGSPLFLNGKRGMLLGVYQMQKFWLLPVFALVPDSAAPVFRVPAEWGWPFLAADPGAGYGFMLFPVVLGFSDLAVSSLPEERALKSYKLLTIYSVLLLVFALAGTWSVWAVAAACLLALFGHEAVIRLGNWLEWKKSPLFVQLGQGVVVFAVIPNSPAEKMGIQTGDVILKVNGQAISHADDLYPALQLQSAFCKMEVRNTEGHIKYLQRAVYQGEHHQLGLILAPDEQTPYYVHIKPVRVTDLFKRQIDKGA